MMHQTPTHPPKKLALVHDIAGYGRCSLTVALPVVSAMGVQACPIPVSVFSNHTGFPVYASIDLLPQLPDYLDSWKKLDLIFDGVYTGFLESTGQAELIRSLFLWQKQKNPECFFLIDPVLGDHGKTYRTITPSLTEAMKQLISLADLITPNVTEACLLTDTPYQESFSEDGLMALSAKLHSMGPSQVVITGMNIDGIFHNFLSENVKPQKDVGQAAFCCIRTPAGGESRPGTGDLFASILAAGQLLGEPLKHSVKKAAQFVQKAVEVSSRLQIPVSEGVCFEYLLHELMEQD